MIGSYVPGPHDVVGIVDDVTTTAETINKMVDVLKPTGAGLDLAYTVVARRNPVPDKVALISLFNAERLL